MAYRVLEEGLTNALKHGTGTAQLGIEYRPSSVRLSVLNDIPGLAVAGSRGRAGVAEGPGTGTGHGLLGMRERAAAVGGTVRAAPGPGPGDTFRVEADLPLRESVVS